VIGDEEYLWAIVDGHVSRYMALASAGHGQYVGVARERRKCTLTSPIAERDAEMFANKCATILLNWNPVRKRRNILYALCKSRTNTNNSRKIGR